MVKKRPVLANYDVMPSGSKEPAKPEPSLVDVKNLVGQMKGMLTWISKERAELQNIITQANELLARLSLPEQQQSPEGPACDAVTDEAICNSVEHEDEDTHPAAPGDDRGSEQHSDADGQG